MSELVRRSLFGYRTATAWWLEADLVDPNAWMPPDERPQFEPAIVRAGRAEGLTWSGTGPHRMVPDVLVAGPVTYLRGDAATSGFDRPPGFTRLEKVLGGRWVRCPTAAYRTREPLEVEEHVGWLLAPATDAAIDAARVLAEDASAVTVACAGATWTFRVDGRGWRADDLGSAVDVRLGYGVAPRLPVVPQGADVVAADELAGPLGLREFPEKPHPTSAEVTPPDDDESEWTVSSDELHELLGVRHAVEAQRLLVQELRRRRSPLARRVEFDSEALLFAAYCRDRRDALALRDLIDELIRGV